MLSRILLFCQLLLCCTSSEQDYKEIDSLLSKAKIIYGEGKRKDAISLIEKALELSYAVNYEKAIVDGLRGKISIYAQLSQHTKVIDNSIELEKYALKLKDYKLLSFSVKTRALSYGELGFYEKSYIEFQNALNYSKKIKDDDVRHYDLSLLYENMTVYFENSSHKSPDSVVFYLKKSLAEVHKISDTSLKIAKDVKYDMVSSVNQNLGLFYLYVSDSKDLNLAEKYLHKALKINEKYTLSLSTKQDLLTSIGELYFFQKNYVQSIEYMNSVLKLEKQKKDPYNRRMAFQILAKSYSGLNDNEHSLKYMNLFTDLNDSIIGVEKRLQNISMNKIIKKKDKSYKSMFIKIIVIGVSLILISFGVGWILWKRETKKAKKKYEIITNRIKADKQINDNRQSYNDKLDKENLTNPKINITDATVKAILLKLEEFEKSNAYLNNEVNLPFLAHHVGTNTKYLSKVIKQHKKRSFSTYINGLRISYVMDLLYSESKYQEYKISYLAELCGFASREVFAAAFKKETGISPSYFIENLKMDTERHV